jgi:hypothetical protein
MRHSHSAGTLTNRTSASGRTPEIGITTALITRKLVSTQVESLWLDDRSPAIWGRETVAIEMSMISMNAANATTGAIYPSTRSG